MCAPFNLQPVDSPLTFELSDTPGCGFSEPQIQWPGGNAASQHILGKSYFEHLDLVIDVQGFLARVHVTLLFCVTTHAR